MDGREEAPNSIAPRNFPGKSETGSFQLPTTPCNFSSALAHQRGLIQLSFAGDNQIYRTQSLIQIRQSREKIEAGFESPAEKCEQAKSKPTGRTCAGNSREIFAGIFLNSSRQSAQRASRRLKIKRAQSFLWSVNPCRPANAEQRILHVHGHNQFVKPGLLAWSGRAGKTV